MSSVILGIDRTLLDVYSFNDSWFFLLQANMDFKSLKSTRKVDEISAWEQQHSDDPYCRLATQETGGWWNTSAKAYIAASAIRVFSIYSVGRINTTNVIDRVVIKNEAKE